MTSPLRGRVGGGPCVRLLPHDLRRRGEGETGRLTKGTMDQLDGEYQTSI